MAFSSGNHDVHFAASPNLAAVLTFSKLVLTQD